MPIELFGYRLEKRLKEKDKSKIAKSFVPPREEDGASVIHGGGVNDYSINFDFDYKSDFELIERYRKISKHPEAESAIDDIINDAIVFEPGEESISINMENLDQPDNIKEAITEEFEKITRLLSFNKEGGEWFRKWYIDGKLYFHIVMDEGNLKKGIREVRWIEPTLIRKIREVLKEKNEQNVEIITGIEEYYLYTPEGAASTSGIKIANEAICYGHSGLLDEHSENILSYLHKAIKPINQLRMLEDSLVIYRLSRAPERRVFYIDVGNLPKGRAEEYLRSVMNKYKNKIVYDATTGTTKDQNDTMTMMEDFWLPRREGGKGTEITTLPGGQNLGDIDDILYFQKKVYKALHVPISRMETDSGFSLGRSAEISRDEIKFNKFVEKLRKRFSEIFYQLLRAQLVAKGIITKVEWKDFKENIDFDFNSDSYFAELKEAEMLKERMEILRDLNDYVGKYVSHGWVRRSILQQSEDEMTEMDKEIKAEMSDPKYKPKEDEDGGY
jgi:hypothetical protein